MSDKLSPSMREAVRRLQTAPGPIGLPKATANALIKRGIAAPGRGGYVITDLGRRHEEEDRREQRRQDRRRVPGAPSYALIREKQEKVLALQTLIGGPGEGYGVSLMIRDAVEDRVFGEEPWPTGRGDAWDHAIRAWVGIYLEIIEDADRALAEAREKGGRVSIGFDVVETVATKAEAAESKASALTAARTADGVVDLGSYRRGR